MLWNPNPYPSRGANRAALPAPILKPRPAVGGVRALSIGWSLRPGGPSAQWPVPALALAWSWLWLVPSPALASVLCGRGSGELSKARKRKKEGSKGRCYTDWGCARQVPGAATRDTPFNLPSA